MTVAAASQGGSRRTVRRPPPFDRELIQPLATINRALPPDAVTPEFIPELRRGTPAIAAPDDRELERAGAFEVTLTSIETGGGPDVPLLICTPRNRTPQAVVCYVHGGGMVAGDSRNGIEEILDWAGELGLVVVSVDYRLAPEWPHPAAVEDCYAAIAWTAAQAQELGCPSGRVVLAGASAGGGLVAGAALMARDRGDRAATGLVLMAPMLDDRNDTVSARQMEGVGVWDRTSNATGWHALLGDSCGGADVSPYAAPARAADLSGLPPVFIDVGSAETFRDEAVSFALRIWGDGGDAELHVWPGGFHGFTAYAPNASISREALAARSRWLRRTLQR